MKNFNFVNNLNVKRKEITMPKLVVMVGPPGSGKSTYSHNVVMDNSDAGQKDVYINQDSQGKEHLTLFLEATRDKKEVVIVDRMNFNKQQRERYLKPAKEAGYETQIIVLHEAYDTCLKRCLARQFHETIKEEKDARSALNTFFSKYERPTEEEADSIQFVYPENKVKLNLIWCDLDGTLCNTDHRQHFMEGSKKNWTGFFEAMDKDPLNQWCRSILNNLRHNHIIVLSSGRPDNYRNVTKKWLEENKVLHDYLFMRQRSDSRRDDIAKEIILDFEVLTRGEVAFAIDDRDQVVKMLRNRGVTVLQCAPGLF